MMNLKNVIAAFTSVIVVMASVPAVAMVWTSAESDERAERAAERETELYEDAMDYVDEGRWEQALERFARVAEMKGSRADGALYWTAYSLRKLGRRAEALRTLEALQKRYPSSRWISDAKALEVEVRQMSGETVAPERFEDEEVKVIAVNALMHTDPEKAYPMLEKIVRGSGSQKMKKQALFVLSQSPSPRAQSLLASIARGNDKPDLQKEAINYLGVAGGERNRQLLSEIYASGSPRAKKEVLNALMISGDKARVHAAATTESDPDVRRSAINLLGVMDGRQELAAMYAKETSRELKKEIIRALFVSGDAKRIADLARREQDIDLRVEAVKSLGIMGAGTAPTLHEIYASEANVRIRKAVVDAFFVQGNARALIDLSKKETDRDLKREMLKKLSVMGNKEAIDYMLQILEQ